MKDQSFVENVERRSRKKMIKKIPVKKCRTCGKILPIDSEFCLNCGSNELEESTDSITMKKICINCGNVLPDDSIFCQYCGSDNLTEIESKDGLFDCPFCKYKLVPGTEVCPKCKKRLSDGKNITETVSTTYSYDKENKKTKNKVLQIVLFSFVLCIGLLGMYYYSDLTKAKESFYTGQKLKVCNLDTTYQNSVIEKKKLEIIKKIDVIEKLD